MVIDIVVQECFQFSDLNTTETKAMRNGYVPQKNCFLQDQVHTSLYCNSAMICRAPQKDCYCLVYLELKSNLNKALLLHPDKASMNSFISPVISLYERSKERKLQRFSHQTLGIEPESLLRERSTVARVLILNNH